MDSSYSIEQKGVFNVNYIHTYVWCPFVSIKLNYFFDC